MADQQQEVLTVPEAARRLGVGVRTVYTAIRAEQVPHLHIASRIVIPRAAFERWFQTAGREEAMTDA